VLLRHGSRQKNSNDSAAEAYGETRKIMMIEVACEEVPAISALSLVCVLQLTGGKLVSQLPVTVVDIDGPKFTLDAKS